MTPTRREKISFDTVRRIGLALPRVEESTAYGAPALKIAGNLMTCLPTHKSAEPGSLVVLMDFSERDELIAAEPETYYLKDHYLNYPVVLVRMARIDVAVLRDLLGMAWRFVSAKPPARKRATATVKLRRET